VALAVDHPKNRSTGLPNKVLSDGAPLHRSMPKLLPRKAKSLRLLRPYTMVYKFSNNLSRHLVVDSGDNQALSRSTPKFF